MKEVRFFYHPDPTCGILPPEEAQHVARVLRLRADDEIILVDGRGTFYQALLTAVSNHSCAYTITATQPQQPEWQGTIHVGVAPTKHLDRIEWLVEKATEIGIDTLSFLCTDFSERKVLKTERLHKIAIAAMKQSHKAWLPRLDEMQSLDSFLARPDLPRQRFIAHCYDMDDLGGGPKPFLPTVLQPREPALVLVGPEGDFSVAEVRAAHAAGFCSVSLGTSRLRTETAALVATHILRMNNQP